MMEDVYKMIIDYRLDEEKIKTLNIEEKATLFKFYPFNSSWYMGDLINKFSFIDFEEILNTNIYINNHIPNLFLVFDKAFVYNKKEYMEIIINKMKKYFYDDILEPYRDEFIYYLLRNTMALKTFKKDIIDNKNIVIKSIDKKYPEYTKFFGDVTGYSPIYRNVKIKTIKDNYHNCKFINNIDMVILALDMINWNLKEDFISTMFTNYIIACDDNTKFFKDISIEDKYKIFNYVLDFYKKRNYEYDILVKYHSAFKEFLTEKQESQIIKKFKYGSNGELQLHRHYKNFMNHYCIYEKNKDWLRNRVTLYTLQNPNVI